MIVLVFIIVKYILEINIYVIPSLINANNTIFLFLLCCTICATTPYIGATLCATILYIGATTCATKKKSDGTGIIFKPLICLASPDPPQKVVAYIPYALYSCATACAT